MEELGAKGRQASLVVVGVEGLVRCFFSLSLAIDEFISIFGLTTNSDC